MWLHNGSPGQARHRRPVSPGPSSSQGYLLVASLEKLLVTVQLIRIIGMPDSERPECYYSYLQNGT
jgi:hypothetical protein